MPTYQYRCTSCGHDFEKFHKITVSTRPKCPRCGKKSERVISGGAGLVFKGSGFYITDYKRAGSDKKEKGEGAGRKSEGAESSQSKRDSGAES
jgi:putative FmdB family regulatory protein